MGTFYRTLRLMGASWEVLKKDRELMLFPVLSSLAAALLMGSFVVPLGEEGLRQFMSRAGQNDPVFYICLFLFYFANSFILIFFNSAIIACALARMTGRDPTVAFGLRAAWRRLWQILLWALATSTVGFVLRLVEERVGIVGQIVVAVLGMAWSVTSFLVVPVLVHTGKGPIEAYTDSVSMLKQSWGEQIVGNVSFALLFGILGVLPVGLVLAVAITGSHFATSTVIALSVVYLLLLGLVQATLQAIYQAAVYCYAHTGSAPEGFDEQALANSFRLK